MIKSIEIIHHISPQIKYEELFNSQNKRDLQNFLIEKDSTKITSIQDTLLSSRKCSKNETQKTENSQECKNSINDINGEDDIENLSMLISSKNSLDHWNPNDVKNNYKLNRSRFSYLKINKSRNSIEFKAHGHHNSRSQIMRKILSQNKSFTTINKINDKEKSDPNLWQELEVIAVPTFSNISNMHIDNYQRYKGYQDIKSLILKRKYIGIHSDKHNKNNTKNHFEYNMPKRIRKDEYTKNNNSKYDDLDQNFINETKPIKSS